MTNNTGDSSKANTARVAIMKQLRLVRAPERPNDAVLEITTVQGPQRFLLPKSAMKALLKNSSHLSNLMDLTSRPRTEAIKWAQIHPKVSEYLLAIIW